MATSADIRRRRYGLVFLSLSGGMLIWGQTILQTTLKRWVFVVYWLVCFLLTGLAMLTAWLDLRATRRRSQAERRELVERAWNGLDEKPNDWDRFK